MRPRSKGEIDTPSFAKGALRQAQGRELVERGRGGFGSGSTPTDKNRLGRGQRLALLDRQQNIAIASFPLC